MRSNYPQLWPKKTQLDEPRKQILPAISDAHASVTRAVVAFMTRKITI
jgi:hypothetical protein